MGNIKKLILSFVLIAGLCSPVFAQQSVDLVGLKGSIVSSTRTIADSATTIPTTALSGRRTIVIYNNGSNTVFIGPSTVTTSNGFPLATGNSISIDATNNIVVYGIVASGTENVRCLEIR